MDFPFNDKLTCTNRIGVFHAGWPVQSQTANCIKMLASLGYRVDLFLYKSDIFYEIETMPNVSIQIFDTHEKDVIPLNLKSTKELIGKPITQKQYDRIIKIAYRFFKKNAWLRAIVPKGFMSLPNRVIDKTISRMTNNRYRCLIGIEKGGLIWAGIMGERFEIPYIYYNLELYTWDYEEIFKSFRSIFQKCGEEFYHRKCSATIIQEQKRARVLLNDNGIGNAKLFYVPVSLIGATHHQKNNFFHQRFSIENDACIILQFGLLYERRMCIELAHAAQTFSDNWHCVMHGWGHPDYISKIRHADIGGRVHISLDRVPADQIVQIISSAHIGLVFYMRDQWNDRLTAFSSEKLALFLQSGIPIISFDYEEYRVLLSRYKCGILIGSLVELPDAINRILRDYEVFRSNAFKCFEQCYDYARNFIPVGKWLERIPVKG